MRRTDHRTARRAVTCCITAALAVSLWANLASPASADPTTSQRREVAAQVAASYCQNVPPIPLLPHKVNAKSLCQDVLVANIDPDGTNPGLVAACATALPLMGKPIAESCAVVVGKLLQPARQVFLQRVLPSAKKLACLATSPGAFDCLAQQVHVWLAQATTALWQGLSTVLTSNTRAIGILDGWHNPGLVSLYSDVGAVAATLLLGLVLVSLVVSVLRFDFRRCGSVLLGIIVWGLFWASGVTIAVWLMKATDDASRWLAGRPDAHGQTDLDRAGQTFADWIAYVSSVSHVPGGVHPVYNPGSLVGMLICVLLIIAIVVTVVALLLRNIALLLMIMLLPITLAGYAGPRLTRGWMTAAFRMFLALLLAKPLIVIAIRLGAVLVSVPRAGEHQATFSDALLGVAIILLAGLLPGVIYRFSGGLMSTGVGAAPRAGAVMSEQAAFSAMSTMDVTRLVMERNLLRQAGTGSAALRGSSAGSLAGATGRAGASSGMAGPLGLAMAAGAVVGGAVESGTRWVAGQAATAGGVLGDVEAPRVPAPPVSRFGMYGGNRAESGQAAAPRPGLPTNGPSVATISVAQQPKGHPGPQLETAGHVIVPGEVVPPADSVNQRNVPPELDGGARGE